MNRLVVVIGAFLLLCGPAILADAALTKDQQKCVNVMNNDLRKLSVVIGKEITSCIKDHNKEKNGVTDIDECVAEDRKEKVAKGSDKIDSDETKKCTGVDKDGITKTPDRFFAGASFVQAAAAKKEAAMLEVIFGSDIDTAAITEAEDKEAAKCQESVAKSLLKCQDTKLKEFTKCKRLALKDGAMTHSEITDCIFDDPKGKIAKICDLGSAGDKKVDKIRKDLDKKCVGKGVVLSDTFPQCESDDIDEVHACMETQVECLTCLAINEADDLQANCDLLDDGELNFSCALPEFIAEELVIKFDPNEFSPDLPTAKTEIEAFLLANSLTSILNTADVFDELVARKDPNLPDPNFPTALLPFNQLYWVKITDGTPVKLKIATLESDPKIQFVEANFLNREEAHQLTPDDLRSGQWNLLNAGQTGGRIDADIDAPQAWELIDDCSPVTVGVIDTGVDFNHRDLAANMVPGFNFVFPPMPNPLLGPPMDRSASSHGTGVAGVIGAVGDNSTDITGVCQTASLMPLRIMGGGAPAGSAPAALAIFAAAMQKTTFLTTAGLQGSFVGVLNGSYSSFWFSQAQLNAINAAAAADILFVVAAGNHGFDNDIGEYIYRDVNNDNRVNTGDVRLDPVRIGGVLYAAGTVVAAGDRDNGFWRLQRFGGNEQHAEAGAANGMYDAGELMWWGNSPVAAGHFRYKDNAGGPAGTRVVAGNADIGTVTIRFNANEKHIIGTGAARTDNRFSTGRYPCRYTAANILCVAAHNHDDQRRASSCWGKTSVDIAGPGGNILTLTRQTNPADANNPFFDPNSGMPVGTQTISGTSFASPAAAGIAALGRTLCPLKTALDIKTDIMFGRVGGPCRMGEPDIPASGVDLLPATAARRTTENMTVTGGRLRWPYGPDLGDAPDPPYPTIARSIGAAHWDYGNEWLGNNASTEGDADTPGDLDFDGAGNLKPFPDSDGFDDSGLTFFPPPPWFGPVTVAVDYDVCSDYFGVTDNEGGRYQAGDPDRAIYHSLWLDIYAPAGWSTPEKVLTDVITVGGVPAPAPRGPNDKVHVFSVVPAPAGPAGAFPPATTCRHIATDFDVPPLETWAPTWIRQRLDYGENLGANLPEPLFKRDPIQFAILHFDRAIYGEVEDYGPPPGGSHKCVWPMDSSITFDNGIAPVVVNPTGSIDITIGTPDIVTGEAPAECNIQTFTPIEVGGLGAICVNPTVCSPGTIDCDGGTDLGVFHVADHNGAGACVDNLQCANNCQALCGTAPMLYSACEGFCVGGANDGNPCNVDTDCHGGHCPGNNPVQHNNTCQCTCDLPGQVPAASRAGGIRCNLGMELVFETTGPCDGADVIATYGSVCVPLTTEDFSGVILNVDNTVNDLPLPPLQGVPGDCPVIDVSILTNIGLVGATTLYDTSGGDMGVVFDLTCQ